MDRTLAMAQRVVHQVTEVLASSCVPLFLTDGLKDYATALLTHYGYWRQPERRQDKGPMPKPRWMPLPALLAELLGGLDQPLQHCVGSDLEDPSRRADPQALSQAGQDVHDEFHRCLFAVENRAVGLQKIPLA